VHYEFVGVVCGCDGADCDCGGRGAWAGDGEDDVCVGYDSDCGVESGVFRPRDVNFFGLR
jgi:hypothetical protein